MATTRRRFTAQFKAKVAMEALRGDRTIQAIVVLLAGGDKRTQSRDIETALRLAKNL